MPHSLTINHLQMTSGVIFIRSMMIIMRDISKARCGAGELKYLEFDNTRENFDRRIYLTKSFSI